MGHRLLIIAGLALIASPVHAMHTVAAPTVLFSDDFSDGNADGWTTTGLGSWSATSGAYVVAMGVGAEREGSAVAGDPSWEDYSFAVDIQGISGVDKIIEARYTDDSNRYTLNLRSAPYNDVVLHKELNGNDTILDSVAFPHTNHIDYHIKFFLLGPKLLIFINDTLVIDHTDQAPYPTQGKIGLIGWTGGTGTDIVQFDNIVVRGISQTYIPIAVR